MGPSAPDPAPAEVAAEGPETPLQDRGQTLCFSALGMVQCCKVGVEARVLGALHRLGEKMGGQEEEGRAGGPGKLWEDAKDVESDRRT